MLRMLLLALGITVPDLALVAAIPEVPTSDVQVVQEGNVYVLHTLIDDHPLYTYDKDELGKSNCNDACAAARRPLLTSWSAKPIGKWTLVKRDDGTAQWAYEGRPVYSFAGDPEGGVWHLLPTSPAP